MQLEENLLQRVNSLVQSSDMDFWRKGRFLVRTDSQLVSYKAGMCKLVNWAPYIYIYIYIYIYFVPQLIGELSLMFAMSYSGMTRLSKSWRTWNTPELTFVSPIAVVGGRKTSLILKGRNLSIPGTQ